MQQLQAVCLVADALKRAGFTTIGSAATAGTNDEIDYSYVDPVTRSKYAGRIHVGEVEQYATDAEKADPSSGPWMFEGSYAIKPGFGRYLHDQAHVAGTIDRPLTEKEVTGLVTSVLGDSGKGAGDQGEAQARDEVRPGDEAAAFDAQIRRVKGLRVMADIMEKHHLGHIMEIGGSRELSLARTKLQEFRMWLGMELNRLNDGRSCYEASDSPDTAKVLTPVDTLEAALAAQ